MSERLAKRSDEDLEVQVRDIYAALAKYEDDVAIPLFEKPSLKHPQSRHILNRYIIAPPIVFVGFSAISLLVGWPLDYIKLAFLFLLLVWYVSFPAVQLMEIYVESKGLLQLLKNANRGVIEGLVETVDSDCLLIQSLKGKSIQALSLARDRISAQRSAIERRFGTMAGALDKVR